MNKSIVAGVVVALVLAALAPLGLYGAPVAGGATLQGHATPSALAVPPPVVYHPVVVAAGTTLYWNGTGENETQLQQGSVTIEPGGSLIIQNITLSMVQFVSGVGTLAERLSNVSRILDAGNLILRSAILTTDANVADSYLKLNLTVSGDLTLWNSSLEFPGWLDIDRAGVVVLNNSVVEANPNADQTGLNPEIIGGTSYAPSITVAAYGSLILLHSQLTDTFADNITANGSPGPAPLSENESFVVTPTSSHSLSDFATPTGTEALIQDWLYPAAYPAVDLVINYTMSTGTVTSEVNLTFNGTRATVAAVTFTPGVNRSITLVLPPPLLEAINAAGPAGFLTSTGSFDHNQPYVSASFNATGVGTSSATVHQIELIAQPGLNFDVGASGNRSTIDLIDSSVALTWAHPASSPASTTPPFPWESNKLVLSHGATAILGNLSIPQAPPEANLTSAILADGFSTAYTFRWVEFQVSGPAGPVPGASVTAFSTGTGADNPTVTRLNNLSLSAPAIWPYLQWWDGQNGLPGYGSTGSHGANAGKAFLLLLSSNLTGTDSGSATYLGGYHAGIRIPVTPSPTEWVVVNATPYPYGLVDPTPDLAPTAYFPQYAAALAVQGFRFTADGVNTTGQVRIGQVLGVNVTVRSSGPTPVFNISGELEYVGAGAAGGVVISTYPLTNITIPPGGSSQLNFSWRVNETVVGAQGTVSAGVVAVLDWNGGPSQLNGGTTNAGTALLVLPSTIAIRSFSAPPQNLSPTQTYTSNGVVVFNGSGLATINVTAIPRTGIDTPVVLATTFARNGSFTVQISNLNLFLTPGVPYELVVTATYNTANATPYVLTGNYTLVSPAPAPAGLAIPWWTWVVVGIAAVLGVVGFLVVRRRPKAQIECGECAALAREGSVTCPQCGIYFELGESRCPRCGVPILTGQLSCPECHYIPSDRPSPPGPEEDRQAYRTHVDQFRAAAQGEIGEDYREVEFWKWWRHQASYQSFRDWKTGQTTRPAGPLSGDPDPMGMGDGR